MRASDSKYDSKQFETSSSQSLELIKYEWHTAKSNLAFYVENQINQLINYQENISL